MKKDKDKELIKTYKKYIKENPLDDPVKSGRTIKDPITVNDNLLKNVLGADTIQLKITATPDNWKKLYRLYQACVKERSAHQFANHFYNAFISPAYSQITEDKLRGKHKKNRRLVTNIKRSAALLYALFSRYCQEPTKEWPHLLLKVMPKKKRQLFKKNGRYNPLLLTATCIANVFGGDIKEYGLVAITANNLSDKKALNNFRKTYITADLLNKYENLINKYGKSNQEIESLLKQNMDFEKIYLSTQKSS